MSGMRILLWKELLEQRRTMRFWAVLVVFLVSGLGSPLLARYTPELIKSLAGSSIPVPITTPGTVDALAQFLKNLGQFGALAAILITMGLVSGEKERGTAGLILTKPASRPAFLLAKFAAVAVTLGIAMIAAGIADYAYTVMLFPAPDTAGFVLMSALLWLSLLVYTALTFVGSTFARSPAAAGGIGFGALIATAIVSALPTVGSFMPSSLAGAAEPYALGQPGPDLLGPVLVNVLIIAACLALSVAAFRRQEI